LAAITLGGGHWGAKNIAEHRITERKVDGTPSAQYIVLATPRLVLVERLS